MSRHKLPPRWAGHEVVVGWDPMQSTYFAHVTNITLEEDDPERDVVWIGCRRGEIHDIGIIRDAVKCYTDNPVGFGNDVWMELYRDANI